MVRDAFIRGGRKGLLVLALLLFVAVAAPRMAYAAPREWVGGAKGTASSPWITRGTRQSIETRSARWAPTGSAAWVGLTRQADPQQNDIIQIGYACIGSGEWPSPVYFYQLSSPSTGYNGGDIVLKYIPSPTPVVGTSYLYQMGQEVYNGTNCWVGRIGGVKYVNTAVTNIFTPNNAENLAEVWDISHDFFVGQQSNQVSFVNYGFKDSNGWHTGLLNRHNTYPTEASTTCSVSGSSSWTTWDNLVP